MADGFPAGGVGVEDGGGTLGGGTGCIALLEPVDHLPPPLPLRHTLLKLPDEVTGCGAPGGGPAGGGIRVEAPGGGPSAAGRQAVVGWSARLARAQCSSVVCQEVGRREVAQQAAARQAVVELIAQAAGPLVVGRPARPVAQRGSRTVSRRRLRHHSEP